MTKIYTCQEDETKLGLQINASHETVDKYMAGKRTLIHLPADWSPFVEASRELAPGDEIGLYVATFPRVHMSKITWVEKIHLQDLMPSDLVALGRKYTDLPAYRKSWDSCWAASHDESDNGTWAWDTNPEVYAIYWEPLKDIYANKNLCPASV